MSVEEKIKVLSNHELNLAVANVLLAMRFVLRQAPIVNVVEYPCIKNPYVEVFFENGKSMEFNPCEDWNQAMPIAVSCEMAVFPSIKQVVISNIGQSNQPFVNLTSSSSQRAVLEAFLLRTGSKE